MKSGQINWRLLQNPCNRDLKAPFPAEVRLIALICLTLACLWSATQVALSAESAASGRVLLRETFDNGDGKGFAARVLRHRHVELAKGAGPDGSDAIRVAYVGNKQGSERIVLQHPLGANVEQATLSFDVRFDRDFQWTFGGKLHGLGPARPVSGGGQRHPRGWSARIMFQKEGRCSTYLYDQDETKKWGIGKATDEPVFVAGQWHHVVFQVRLNDPAGSNGFARILVDGQNVLETENVVFRGTGGGETEIQQFLFSTFHGGNTTKWTPVDANGTPVTVHAYFDNIVITEGIQHPADNRVRPVH